MPHLTLPHLYSQITDITSQTTDITPQITDILPKPHRIPKPLTLLPKPQTLLPKPQTLLPKPPTVLLKPPPLLLKPPSLLPKPLTLLPKSPTLLPKPQTAYPNVLPHSPTHRKLTPHRTGRRKEDGHGRGDLHGDRGHPESGAAARHHGRVREPLQEDAAGRREVGDQRGLSTGAAGSL